MSDDDAIPCTTRRQSGGLGVSPHNNAAHDFLPGRASAGMWLSHPWVCAPAPSAASWEGALQGGTRRALSPGQQPATQRASASQVSIATLRTSTSGTVYPLAPPAAAMADAGCTQCPNMVLRE